MKKIFALIIAVVFVFTVTIPIFADGETAGEETVNGKPFVGGALVGNDNGGTVYNPAGIDYQQLETAYNEILELAKNDKNILAVKIMQDSYVILLVIDGDPEQQKEYIKRFDEKYGSFFILTDDVDSVSVVGEQGLDSGGASKEGNALVSIWIWSVLGVILIGTASIFILKLRRIHALQMSDGKFVMQNVIISKKETISAIKKCETIPNGDVFVSILHAIDKKYK